MANREFSPNKSHKIGLLSKTDSTQVRVQIHEFDNRSVLDIRQFYKRKGDEKFNPGKGISIDVNNIKRLKSLLTKALTEADDLGLLRDDD